MSTAVFEYDNKPSSLEGATTLGLHIHNPGELIHAITTGFHADAAQKLADQLELSLQTLADQLDLPIRTLQQARKDAKPLSQDKSETLYRTSRIFERAIALLGDEAKARRWMTTPKFGLGNETPLRYARSEPGGEIVLDLIDEIMDGGPA